MPRGTILAKIYSRTLGLSGPGPIWTCKKLTWTYRRDGAGSFRAEFPNADAMLGLVSLKNTYLYFSVGGRDVFLGLVERVQTRMARNGRQTVIITGRDQLGALAENTVGGLDLAYVYNAPSLILGASNVPNQTFSLSADGYSSTSRWYAKTFAGETALAALIRVAADLGEHFRAPTDGTLEVVWLRDDTPDAPIRLVSSGGPLLHENESVAIIEEIERDADGFEMTNVVYAYGSGNAGARLTLQYATLGLPSGYSYGSDSNGYYIQNDAQQILPSVRRAAWKSFNHIGITPDTYEMTPASNALTGATTIVLEEAVPFAIADGTLIDLNGLGVDFVELSAALSAGGNVLNVVALGFDVLTTDTLVYTDPVALEGAANQLAQAAVTWLQRVSDPDKMVAYDMTVRGLPDSVQVGMKIPVLSQAPGFAIDDDLIILEITRTADSKGRTPATLKVVPVDWFAPGEAANLAMQLEELQNYQAQSQPVSYASISGTPTIPADFTDLADTFAAYTGLGGYVVKVKGDESGLEAVAGSYSQEQIEDMVAALIVDSSSIDWTYSDGTPSLSGVVIDEYVQDLVGAMLGGSQTGISVTYSDVAGTLIFDAQTAGDARYAPIAKGVTNGDSHDHNGGDGAQIAYSSLSGTPTVYTQEQIEDFAAAMLTGNTGRVQASYNDAAGTITLILDVSAADKILYSTAADTWSETAITSFIRGLLDDADAATARTTLGVTVYDAETTQDIIGAMATDSASIDFTYDDSAGTLSAAVITEAIQDIIGAFLVDSTSIDFTYNDAGNAITVAVIDEYVQDVVGALLVDGNGIDLTYNDGTPSIVAALTALTSDWTAGAARAILIGTVNGDSAANGDLTLQGTTSATRTSSYVNIQPNGGKVGIGPGASAPVGLVEISDVIGTLYVSSTGAGTGDYAFLGVRNDTNEQIQYFCFGSGYSGSALGIPSARYGALLMAGAGSNGLMIGTVPNKPVIFGVNSAEVMRLEAGGLTFANAKLISIDNVAALDSSGLSLKDDGGNLAVQIIDGGVVAVGGLTSAGASVLGVKAGTSTNDAAVGGVLYVTTTQTGNVGAGEDDLASYSVPANTLAVNGQSVWFEAWGSFAANSNNKQVRARFGTSGTNLVFDSTSVASNGGGWVLRGRIFRTGAATQKSHGSWSRSSVMVAENGLNQTLSGAVTLKITGEATSNNDIVLEGFIVGYDDANT